MEKMKNFGYLVMILTTVLFSACSDNYDDLNDDFWEEPTETNNDNPPTDNNDGTINNNGNPDYVALYEINGDQIVKIEDGSAGATWMHDDFKHQEIWNRVTQLIEAGDRPWIKQLMIIDGGGGLYGFVQELNDNLDEWVMGLAIDAAYPNQNDFDQDGEMTYTIIHEFAHVLTLNNEQLQPFVQNCSTYNPGEGCSHQHAYINQFFGNYWSNIANEHAQIGEEDEDGLFSFYQKYQDYFVTDYAATNPAEDIAESFTHFVKLDNKPAGNAIAQQKVKFMYEYPELNRLRDFMKSQGQALRRPANWKGCRSMKKGFVAVK